MYLEFFLMVMVIILAVVLFLRYKEINTYLLSIVGRTEFTKRNKEFYQLLNKVRTLDHEGKMRVCQAILGHKVTVVSECTSNQVSLKEVIVTGYDQESMAREDKSIG